MEWAAKAGVSCEMPTQTVPRLLGRIVNAVGDAHAAGVGEEVMIVHGTGERSHLAPVFLKLPISSRFLLSTLMMGRPCRWKRDRSEEIFWNC